MGLTACRLLGILPDEAVMAERKAASEGPVTGELEERTETRKPKNE